VSEASSADKSAPASPKRIEDSRKKGQSPKSPDVTSALLFFALTVFVYLCVEPASVAVQQLWQVCLDGVAQRRLAWHEVMAQLLRAGLWIVLPPLIALVAAVLAGMLQVGLRFSTEALSPGLEKIDPVEGLKRLCKPRRLVELGKSVLALLLVAWATWLLLRQHLNDLVHIPSGATAAVLDVGASLISKLMALALPLFFVMGIGDFLFQRFVWLQDLRMTQDEVRREHKEQDGDPKIKSQRKQMAHELLEPEDQSLLDYITVLVTGSQGQVVALFHDPSHAPLPMLLFKYQAEQGQALLAVAAERRLPVLAHDALARQLFIRGRKRQYVPRECAAELGALMRA